MAPDPEGARSRRLDGTDTRWSRIEAGDLEYVVRRYWRPVRRFLQTRLGSLEEAEDATQELFVKFIEKDLLGTADAARGRFRSYLFTVARRFLVDRLRARSALSRGGLEASLPLDASPEIADLSPTAEEQFDRDWFFGLLNQARREVRAKMSADGRDEVYRAFHLYYFGDDSEARWTQQQIADRLALPLTQVNNHVHRCRELMRREVRAAIADYAGDETELEVELALLRRHMGGPTPMAASEIFADEQ